MSIIAPRSEKKEYKIVPAGNHIARVYRVIHVGTVKSEYMGEEKIQPKVRIGFELPNETAVFKEGDEPKPFVIDEEYTLSMYEKAKLRHLIEGIIGSTLLEHEADAFDVVELMGRACMLNVVHNTKGDKTYANIASAAPLPKGIEAPAAVNAPFLLDYNDNWDEQRFADLPEFIRTKMATTPEYKAKFGIKDVAYEENDLGESPF